MPLQHVGHYVKQFILEKQLVQRKLAEKLGVTATTLSRNLQSPSWDMELFYKASQEIGFDPANIFNEVCECKEEDTYNEVTNFTNFFGGTSVGKIITEIGDSQETTALLKAIIAHQAALIQEKERLISVLLAQKEPKGEDI